MEIVGFLAAALKNAKDRHTARDGAFERFHDEGTRSFRHDESAAILGKRACGLFRRVVLGRKRREKRKAGEGLGRDRAVRSDRKDALALTTADRLDAELDRGRSRGTRRRKGHRQATRAEAICKPVGDMAELRAGENVRVRPALGDGEQRFIVRLSGFRALDIEQEPVVPFQLDGRGRQKQRSAEVVERKTGLSDRFLGRRCGEGI